MKIKISLGCFVFILFGCGVFSQPLKQITLKFHPVYGTAELTLSESGSPITSNEIRIETLKFYISGIEFMDNNHPAWKEENSYHLVDASENNSLIVSVSIPPSIFYNRIKFNVGIDSATNVSGALGGDLDPTKGMYWTWQSGYINFKLEGKSIQCNTRNHEFQFHLGGYQYPFQTLQTVALPTNPQDTTYIEMNLEQFLSGIDLSKQNQVMTSGIEAASLSEKLSKIFSIRQK